jgi:hydrogenase expression/formation protein HypE
MVVRMEINLEHGAGGKLTHELFNSVFYRAFKNKILEKAGDKAILSFGATKIAFTTDAFVMSPKKVSGCSVGKLSVTGTVNDLLTCGAVPLYLSASFIIEEGYSISNLSEIVKEMSEAANISKVSIVTGDTKVVEKGKADGIYITTSGIGKVMKNSNVSGSNAEPGDVVLVSGPVGTHGTAVMLARGEFGLYSNVTSDCCPLNDLVIPLIKRYRKKIKVIRDPTRGGLATTLNEIAQESKVGIVVEESKIPVLEEVRSACEVLGIDYLSMANEGIMVFVVDRKVKDSFLKDLRKNKKGRLASLIGEVASDREKKVVLSTSIGGERILDMTKGLPLPRIC